MTLLYTLSMHTALKPTVPADKTLTAEAGNLKVWHEPTDAVSILAYITGPPAKPEA